MKYSLQKIIVILFVFLMSCSFENLEIEDNNQKPEIIYLDDLIELDEVDSVYMNNNKASHKISKEKFPNFIDKLKALKFNKGSYKVGSINFILFIKHDEIIFSGNTHGNYIEMASESISKHKNWVTSNLLYFESNSLNLNNF